MARLSSVADHLVARERKRIERLRVEERVQEALALGEQAIALLAEELGVDPREALSPATWRALREQGVEIEIRVAVPGDPLAGVLRISSGSAPAVDLMVRAADLVRLEPYAAGPQDL